MMNKKLITAMTIALLLAASLAGSANAETRSQKHGPAIIGQVEVVGTDRFSMQTPGGELVEVVVSEQTRFRSARSDAEPGLDDLDTGMWAAVIGRAAEEGVLDALAVVFLPADFDPGSFRGRQIFGEITQINNGQQTIQITNRAQVDITISIVEETRFLNGITNFQDLERGMQVYVIAVGNGEGELIARVIAEIGPTSQPNRVVGALAGQTEDTLTIKLRGGTTQEFSLTDETTFRSLDGSAAQLSDLENGHVLVVTFILEEGGGYSAANIIATGEALNRALHNLERASGLVQSAGGSHLTIQNRDREIMQFTVPENARIRGREGELVLNDLKNGTPVLVFYTVGEGGELNAYIILVPGDGSPTKTP